MDPVSPDVLKKKQRNKKRSLLLAAEFSIRTRVIKEDAYGFGIT